jgi:hypothetical protein
MDSIYSSSTALGNYVKILFILFDINQDGSDG